MFTLEAKISPKTNANIKKPLQLGQKISIQRKQDTCLWGIGGSNEDETRAMLDGDSSFYFLRKE